MVILENCCTCWLSDDSKISMLVILVKWPFVQLHQGSGNLYRCLSRSMHWKRSSDSLHSNRSTDQSKHGTRSICKANRNCIACSRNIGMLVTSQTITYATTPSCKFPRVSQEGNKMLCHWCIQVLPSNMWWSFACTTYIWTVTSSWMHCTKYLDLGSEWPMVVVMLLNKINQSTISVLMTNNGWYAGKITNQSINPECICLWHTGPSLVTMVSGTVSYNFYLPFLFVGGDIVKELSEHCSIHSTIISSSIGTNFVVPAG